MRRAIAVALTVCIAAVLAGSVAAGEPPRPEGMLQFTSGGHALGFSPGAVVFATGSHALRVEFCGASSVQPVAEGGGGTEASGKEMPGKGTPGKAAPLGRISYPGLWKGISLAYDGKEGGVARTTWTVEAGADPGLIRLRYNVPVAIQPDGGLKLSFPTGWMSESAPAAWQEVGGKRVTVKVAFRPLGEKEVGFALGDYDRSRTLWIDPILSWNTFLGSTASDYGYAIAVDGSGTMYVTGASESSWGSPLRAHSGGYFDCFVAKLSSSGTLLWNTFLGSAGWDEGHGIALDGSGNVYVVGWSDATWGSPLHAYTGYYDAFVAKLGSSGTLLWHTFFGDGGGDYGDGIAVDGSGNVHITGMLGYVTLTPLVLEQAFVAKYSTAGALQWSTSFGAATSYDYAHGIALDASGNVYFAGRSDATWGSPTRAYSSGRDTFVAKLNSSGTLLWNTFLGGSGDDWAWGIAVDEGGNTYVTGQSNASWGSPLLSHSGGFSDAFVAKLNTSGTLLWNTFLGSAALYDYGLGIAVDEGGNAYVTGVSGDWGSPLWKYSNGWANFVAKLGTTGTVLWSAVLGSTAGDSSTFSDQGSVALDGKGGVHVTGSSIATWGSPLLPALGTPDAFVAKISDWRMGEVDLGGGWKWSSWLGYYNMASAPWVYHQEHRWLYPFEDGSGGAYFYYNDLGTFIWTNPTTYSYLYRFGTSAAWLWYLKDSANPRWFYNLTAGSWESLP